ncbi:hypothetical protein [Wenxinia saemankumensis]|uniref:Uncharacterized protein n=1 Tax=Wenxinia saemankumensis TaxID=1447782 RepID=A0A1M6GNB8_9RHOB|nr:hypothetical protein [Wenxinia saemankumensis]SHJ11484.1 hypothetical protein SAMN05444417_2827 [Wenxinia saemankumensis]
MPDTPPIESAGRDYVLTLGSPDRSYRVTVPGDFLDDETGPASTDAERRSWIEANLPGILSALTARETGGMVREPWGRVVVEELP